MNPGEPGPAWRDADGRPPAHAAPHADDGWWRWLQPPDEAAWSGDSPQAPDQDPPTSATMALLIRLLALAVPLLVAAVGS